MAGPWHALTPRSKLKRSNPNPKHHVFVMGMGRDVEQRECAYGYDFTFLYLLSIFIKWKQVLSKLTFAQFGSACRYDCTFF